jgi:hypothetical protein
MASAIGQALGSIQQQGDVGYQAKGRVASIGATQVQAPRGSNGLAESMRTFMSTGVEAFGQYEANQRKTADERSNEIIRSMTPEQRRAATQDGTLLYKDDPMAMMQLSEKTGRNAAYEVDSEIQTKVQAGHFKTTKEMQEYRQTRLEDVRLKYAESSGIDPNDTNYKRGFDSDITQRNAALYDIQNQHISKNLEAQAALEARNDLQPMMADPKILGSKDGAYIVSNYINQGLQNGGFPSDKQAVDSMVMLANDAITKDGGGEFLKNFGQQKIKVLGGEQSVENLLGPEVYQNLITKANTEAYSRNAKRTEGFMLGLANATADADPAAGWQKLNKLEQENNWVQQGDQMTPQRQLLIQAKASMIEAVKRQSLVANKELETRAQADNRLMVIDQAYERRQAGENISVNPKFLPVDANTGEYKDSDMATYAAKKLQMIDAMGIPQEQKDQMKLAKLQADYEKGPFKAAFKTLVDDSANEWAGAVVRGDATGFKRITELQRVYAQNPSLISQLYPEQAGLLAKLDLMSSMNLDPNILIAQEAGKKGQSQDERKFADEQWAAVKNDSSSAELTNLPAQFETIGRAVYDAHRSLTGDSSAASRAVTEYLKKNTVSFSEDRGWGKATDAHGMLAKADLQVDPDNTQSWEAGRQILDETLVGLAKDSVWGQTGRSITASNGNIVIHSFNGQRMTISKEQFQTIYKERQATETLKRDKAATEAAMKQQQDYETFKNGGIYNRGGAATKR